LINSLHIALQLVSLSGLIPYIPYEPSSHSVHTSDGVSFASEKCLGKLTGCGELEANGRNIGRMGTDSLEGSPNRLGIISVSSVQLIE
jgi:hypothetical protein